MNFMVTLISDAYELLETKPLVSLTLACIAIDASSKEYYKLKNPNSLSVANNVRYKLFLKDHMPIIMGTGKIKIIAPSYIIGESKAEDIIYIFIRCALLHDGYISNIELGESIGINGKDFCFQKEIIEGLLLAVVLSEVNKKIVSDVNTGVAIVNKTYKLNDVWGKIELFWSNLKELTEK